MWFPASIWFIFPITLDLIPCFFDNHMTFRTIRLEALALAPLGTNALMTCQYAPQTKLEVNINENAKLIGHWNDSSPNADASCLYGQLVPYSIQIKIETIDISQFNKIVTQMAFIRCEQIDKIYLSTYWIIEEITIL